MPKQKISEFNSNPALNTDIDSINIAEGCSPSGINDAIRELMSQLKDWQSGTSNDPMVIGSSGSLTLNQGTANGVAYLNGSKVVTSGSALTFDGTSILSNTVATGTTPTTPAEIRAATSTSGSGWSTTAPWARFSYYSADTSDSGPKVQIAMDAISSASTGGLSDWVLSTANVTTGTLVERYRVVSDSGNSIWSVGGSEGMRLTSTGLGIGTSSPAAKLQIGTGSATGLVDTVFLGGNSTNTAQFRWVWNHQGAGYLGIGTASDAYGSMIFGQASGGTGAVTTEFMRLDGSGNLGLGVTPSAWSSLAGGSAIQLYSGGIYSYSNYATGISENSYYANGDKYIASSIAAAKYMQIGGAHSWYTAPSGTAGNAITFTQAMSLLSSGAWVLGDTSVVASGFAGVKFNGASFNGLGLNDSSATSGAGYVYFQSNGTTIGSITRVASTSAVAYNTTSDQRLKNDLGVVTSTDVIADTVIHDFTWKSDGSKARGVFAQEAAKTLPSAVKVGDNGEEVTDQWQVDYSKYIPDIIVELQALRARVAELEAK